MRYLSRYTYKIAISNQRILAVDEHSVTFAYTDYADHNKRKTMRLTGVEFLRRFLQHILPKGFMRIRHYGFLANAVRKKRIDTLRQLLAAQGMVVKQASEKQCPEIGTKALIEASLCPRCQQGYFISASKKLIENGQCYTI